MLILDASVGGVGSNAYALLPAVLAIADEVFPVPTTFLDLSPDDQSRIIVQMTRRIDQERHLGERAGATQALAYPRRGAPGAVGDGTGYDDGLGSLQRYEDPALIPDRVKRALAYGAFGLASIAASETDPLGSSDHAGLSSVSLGSEFSATFEAGAGSWSAFERMFAQTVRPILGTLITSPQLRLLRG